MLQTILFLNIFKWIVGKDAEEHNDKKRDEMFYSLNNTIS